MNNNADNSLNMPGGLPLVVSGLGAGGFNFGPPSTFWEDVARVSGESLLADHLDSAMSGKSSPRVWLFLHEPGESHLSVASAMGFARELAHRDQAVLLLDGDDDKADLTTWAGRDNVDGWIDLVRYGSSVLTCGIPMPFEGRRGYMLGVGSFTPAEVTGVEIKDLLTRLRRQADDILIVAPANEVGRLWAAEADIRLFCWDRPRRSVTLVDNILDNFSSTGIPLTALIGFGLAQDSKVETDTFVEELIAEEPVKGAAAILDDLEEEDDEFFHEEDEFARRKGNSKVFWGAAAVFVVLIGAASAYYMQNLLVPAGGHFPAAAQHEVALGGAAFFDSGAGSFVDDSIIDADQNTIEDIGETGTVIEDHPVKDDMEETTPPEIVSPEPEPEALKKEIPVQQDPAKIGGKFLDDGFAMDPYLVPVGSGGWALHVYSFPDSLRASRESKALAAKGFKSSIRAVQFKDKGRWFRLYLGSFETKAEANAASKKLKAELGENWANPTLF